MSTVNKTSVAPSASPVAAPRGTGAGARQPLAPVSELNSQAGVSYQQQQNDFSNFSDGGSKRRSYQEQPTVLKLSGTSRTFAMLFEQANDRYSFDDDDDFSAHGDSGGTPTFPAYVSYATERYDLANSAVSGENRQRGKSFNFSM